MTRFSRLQTIASSMIASTYLGACGGPSVSEIPNSSCTDIGDICTIAGSNGSSHHTISEEPSPATYTQLAGVSDVVATLEGVFLKNASAGGQLLEVRHGLVWALTGTNSVGFAPGEALALGEPVSAETLGMSGDGMLSRDIIAPSTILFSDYSWGVFRLDPEAGTVTRLLEDDRWLEGEAPNVWPYLGVTADADGTMYVMSRTQLLALYLDGTREIVAGADWQVGDPYLDGAASEATFGMTPPCCYGMGIAHHAGSVYVADAMDSTVRRVDLVNEVVETVAGVPPGGTVTLDITQLSGPEPALGVQLMAYDLDVGPDGAVYLVDRVGSCVVVLRDGILYPLVGRCGEPGFAGDGGPALEALLDLPDAISVSPDGAWLYIADAQNDRVRAVRLAEGPESPAL